jgi:hypothetical protein
MQKIDDCKEIRLTLTRAGVATRPGKCLQTFRLVVTAQYIYHNYQLMRHVFIIVARAEYHRHDIQLVGVMLGVLGQLRSDIEFLVLIESQACRVHGLELLRE